MVQFHVSTPALGFSAASMTGAVAQFDAQLAQVTAAVNAVVGSTWTGSAADAFLEEWTSFLTSAGVTREALMSIAARLQSGQSTYEGNEAQLTVASRSSNVNIRVPGVGGNNGGAQASAEPAAAEITEVQAMPADVTIDARAFKGDTA
ncbi:WXG100 family type VII secretion target [Microbacterium sp. 1.5R]|uniref:WXG100 family type VII secretion target n=1 Tax=Microbacterium sp. 1.5R TaxID=1916917 RepID=UPI00119F81D7|nr:WXG100 family type VII secretion target [Microbacterium sp. 1.5R]